MGFISQQKLSSRPSFRFSKATQLGRGRGAREAHEIPPTHSHGVLSSCCLCVHSFHTSLCWQVPTHPPFPSFPWPHSCGNHTQHATLPCWRQTERRHHRSPPRPWAAAGSDPGQAPLGALSLCTGLSLAWDISPGLPLASPWGTPHPLPRHSLKAFWVLAPGFHHGGSPLSPRLAPSAGLTTSSPNTDHSWALVLTSAASGPLPELQASPTAPGSSGLPAYPRHQLSTTEAQSLWCRGEPALCVTQVVAPLNWEWVWNLPLPLADCSHPKSPNTLVPGSLRGLSTDRPAPHSSSAPWHLWASTR